VRSALCEPAVDNPNVHLRNLASLRRRQHFAGEPADVTMSGEALPDDPLLLEDCDLYSSSLYRSHKRVLISAISLSPMACAKAAKLTHASLRVWKEMGNKSEIIPVR
jgi:hypothetical protein